MNERTKNSASYQVGDIVKFIGVSYGTPHPEIGVVVSTNVRDVFGLDDPKMIQVSFNGFLKYVSTSHPQPQLEVISASLKTGENQ
jgi:hypothetical protein